MDTFIYVIAHELCYIVLHSLREPYADQNDEEQVTDLAVIFSGFKNSYLLGRNKVSGRAGYLNDTEAEYAALQYEKMLHSVAIEYRYARDKMNDLCHKYDSTLRFVSMVNNAFKRKDANVDSIDIASVGICLSTLEHEQALRLLLIKGNLETALSAKRYAGTKSIHDDLTNFENRLKSIALPTNEHITTFAKYFS